MSRCLQGKLIRRKGHGLAFSNTVLLIQQPHSQPDRCTLSIAKSCFYKTPLFTWTSCHLTHCGIERSHWAQTVFDIWKFLTSSSGDSNAHSSLRTSILHLSLTHSGHSISHTPFLSQILSLPVSKMLKPPSIFLNGVNNLWNWNF